MDNEFIIEKNTFLKENTIGYYHQFYTKFGQPDNPNFVNVLKCKCQRKSEPLAHEFLSHECS